MCSGTVRGWNFEEDVEDEDELASAAHLHRLLRLNSASDAGEEEP